MASNSQTSEKDIGWQHGYCKDPKNKVSVTCKFCGKEAKGGIYRLKQHLVGGFRNITGCTKVPEHVKEEVTQFMVKKKTLKDQITDLPDLDDIDMNPEEENECDNVVDPRAVRSKVSKRAHGGSTRGSMHSYFQPASASEKGKTVSVKQTTINNHYKKELREKACADIARWMYDAAIPFNVVNHDSFKDVIESIGRYGIGMKAPSYHEVRVPLLKKEVQKTNAALKSHREEWTKTGCSIMSDGWADRNHRSIINFLVNCAKGSIFLESVDASAYSQTAERKAELLSRIIEKVGPSNVVQIITDNDSSYKLAETMLEAKYPHIYWTPCAAHCIDLILEDIGKLPNIARTIKRAVEVCGFIYNRVGLVNMLRKFTNQKNLIRPAKTRFATSFFTLKSINNQRANLRKMFTSQEWTSSKWVKEQGGKRISSTILIMPTFWSTVVYTLKVTAPLVDVLLLVDGEIKSAMGYIYEAMDRAKERIAAHLNGKESKYEEVFEIIDKRWNCQLHRPLHSAGYFLNPEFFYANSESIEQDEEVMHGLYNCLGRLAPDTDVQDQISNDIAMYRNACGLFGTDLAIRHRTRKAPADWWSAYGASTPSLQRFAIKILSLTCSSSGCERNWSVFEQIHSKRRNRRNRLSQARLNDLVYVKYNRALIKRFEMRHKINPIKLKDIDESNEWLTGIVDEDVEAENERVFGDEDDDLTWGDVAQATGVHEQRFNMRPRSSGRNDNTSRTAASSSTSSHSRTQPTIVVEDDVEEEEEDDEGYQSNPDSDDHSSFEEDEDDE